MLIYEVRPIFRVDQLDPPLLCSRLAEAREAAARLRAEGIPCRVVGPAPTATLLRQVPRG